MKLVHTLRRIFSDKGLLLTLALSLLVLCVFYGKLLLHPCTTYFGAGGDGLQIYYQTLYHTKFDPEFWRQQSINYPYGESIFFTGAMPFVNNFVKLFGPSAAPLGIGLINLSMLFSPVIGALFLYAIFRHLRLPWHYGAVAATAIAFLSPQIGRFTGHYSLSWVFLIPALIYLLLRFYDYPSLTKSWLIAFIVFLGATTHLYFLAFFAALGGVYWAALFLTRDRGFGRFTFALKHASLQFLLPVVVLQVLVMMSDKVADRTVAPWGYLHFHSNSAGVLFPFGKPYEALVRKFIEPWPVDVEGVAYIGLAAMAGIVGIIFVQLYRLARGRVKLLLSVTDNKVLNIFFWTSLFLLYVSFAKPFLNGHEEWLVHLGPLRQFRAVGRFAWVFFYVINIIAVYRLYKISLRKNYLRYAVMFCIPAMLLFDAYYNIRGQQELLNNRLPELDDEANVTADNAWLRDFRPSGYQAILPLPYFHIGSENLMRVPADPEIIYASYIVSLKTGLPMMAVSAARVSMGQTLKQLPIVFDPFRPAPVLKDLPDKRPLLLVVREATLDENERRLLALAKPVATSVKYKVYSLDPARIMELSQQSYETARDSAKAATHPVGEFMSNDSAAQYIYHSFDQLPGKPAYHGKGAYQGKFREYNQVFNGTVPVAGEYKMSFWVNKVNEDIFPRSVIEVYAYDTTDNKKSYYLYTNVFARLALIDGSWGLAEFPVTIPADNARLQVTLWNSELKPDDVCQVDELFIRPARAHFYKTEGDTIIQENRRYFPLK